jgi:hypothetical protein
MENQAVPFSKSPHGILQRRNTKHGLFIGIHGKPTMVPSKQSRMAASIMVP